MSFLTRTSTTTLRTLRFAPRASFSTSLRSQKSAAEIAKDAVKTVDRTVSEAAVKGIEKGQEAAAATREAIGVNASKAEGAAQETAGSAKGTASEMAGDAKGKASELAGKTKGNVAEMKGTAKAKAKEVTSDM